MLACQYAYHYEMMYFSLLCRGSHVDLFKDKLGSAQLYSLKKPQFIFLVDGTVFRMF